MPRIYLASPLGFSPEQKPYLDRIKDRLHQLGYDIFDPWSLHFGEAARQASQIEIHDKRVKAARVAREIGAANENGIVDSDILLAVLDGADADSGTSAEVGFAAGIGRRATDCGLIGGTPEISSDSP